eukprot:CAMPEP_0115828926 /NCGR_PEP_ID=MMETSP0287-20121206/830_1 /TAXON_ID=412157 /ORGANISM="Chrysochromulina rotalis, Strain UIO044" /LENGTH=80 /DNA_ID=CAMNT_0003282167 /DNA_START=405 /DNA_END=648 /DNA_ORIENTATION=-
MEIKFQADLPSTLDVACLYMDHLALWQKLVAEWNAQEIHLGHPPCEEIGGPQAGIRASSRGGEILRLGTARFRAIVAVVE